MKEGDQGKKRFFETCGCISIHCSQAQQVSLWFQLRTWLAYVHFEFLWRSVCLFYRRLDPATCSPNLHNILNSLFNIISPSMSTYLIWYFPFKLSDRNFVDMFHLSHVLCEMMRAAAEYLVNISGKTLFSVGRQGKVFKFKSDKIIKTDSVRINLTLTCVRATIVAAEKQQVLHILKLCL
jgi:hypothetical protein